MTTIDVSAAKFALSFKAGQLPRIDPNNPQFVINLSGCRILSKISAKAARKLQVHAGGAVLTGKLIVQNRELYLAEAGIQFLDVPPPHNP